MNKLQLHLSAAQAAQKAVTLNGAFESETLAMAEFNAGKNSPLDYDFWRQEFNDRLQHYKGLAAQDAPSTFKAKLAAQTKK